MSAKTMTLCGSVSGKEKLGLPESIICPYSVYNKWETVLLAETDGVVSSESCTINQLINLF